MLDHNKLREQPILDINSIRFEIERPRFYYTPPNDEYSYLARYFLFMQICNISSYAATFVDLDAYLIIEENENQLAHGLIQKRVNIIPAATESDEIHIIFTGDYTTKIMESLRDHSTYDFPKLQLTVTYRSLSGANYLLKHTYILNLEIDNPENVDILRNWHSTLVSAPIEEKEMISTLRRKRTENRTEWNETFNKSEDSFDKKLLGGESLPINMIEIKEDFLLKSISDTEYTKETIDHKYGQYVGRPHHCCSPKSHDDNNLINKS